MAPETAGGKKPYHRLDLSFNYSKITNRRNQAEWTFSLYNAYNRQNPYYYYYITNNTGEMIPPDYFEEYKPLSLYQVSFFPIIPSVSYKVFFNGAIRGNNKQTPKLKERFINWLFYKTSMQ